MFRNLRQLLKPPVFAGDEEKTRVARLAFAILLTTMTATTMATVMILLFLPARVLMGVIYVCMMAPLLVVLGLLRRGYVRGASLLMTLSLWLVLAVVGFFIGGVTSSGYQIFALVIIMAAMLLGPRAGVAFAALSIGVATIAFIVEQLGLLPPQLGGNTAVNHWMSHLINYVVAGGLLYMATNSLTAALRKARQLTAESESRGAELNRLVEERTQDLTRSMNYLTATTAVARESAALGGDPEELLDRVARLIGEQFGFYHTAIYLLDENGGWAELRAAASPARQHLLSQGQRLRVGAQGIVGDVAYRGVYRLAADVSQDDAYYAVPELPDTRAELALPLRLRNEVMGVLDIQTKQVNVFSEQDVQTLQALADQVAMIISNSRLLAQVQAAAELERRAYGIATGKAWQTLLQAGQSLGFYSNVQATTSISNLWRPEMKTALRTGRTVQADQDVKSLAVPVKVRGEVIGVIDFAKGESGGGWTGEEVTLVESLTEQLGVALDSARLYQDTQRRAAQERLVAEVGARVRESLELETMLQTAVQEMRQALNLDDLVVRLATPDMAAEDKEG